MSKKKNLKKNQKPPVSSVSVRCLRCKRPLKNEESIKIGYGSSCAKLEGIIISKRKTIKKYESRSLFDF